ncbi:Ribosomal protein S18 acetylase RimI [Lentibacillus persicus]|uniref:Ribosomal protein S18 acetylase RimI n=1 Tax=Lentibacillus persicus TaxID=640948 RepID=A0A1I1ZEK7_9BACI|nr:GNAT family N-acetyltransferase [Lentibacillus persicus]SFE29768.1 Ribosomal protein S18 acetylase RimI [Lentibacillus persicus]
MEKHCEEVVKFRSDSFAVSFGNTFDFDKEEYLNWLKEKIANYPEGFVLAKEDNKFVGQLELSIRKYEDKEIGYVHLYYITPEERGKGKGQELHDYAKQFFKSNNVSEYHLRVSPTNTSAVKFYRKIGMNEIGPEMNGKVIRMRAYL